MALKPGLLVALAVLAFAAPDASAGRLVAIESQIDAGLPCGDSVGHVNCGHDDSVVTFPSDGGRGRTLARRITDDHYERLAAPGWSPDGRRVVFRRGLQPATVRADGTHQRLLQPDCCFFSLAWAHAGRHLLL